jgi:hypothetical protein
MGLHKRQTVITTATLVLSTDIDDIVSFSIRPVANTALAARPGSTAAVFVWVEMGQTLDSPFKVCQCNVLSRATSSWQRLVLLGARSTGGRKGSVIEHLGFSVPDLDATMRSLAAVNTNVDRALKKRTLPLQDGANRESVGHTNLTRTGSGARRSAPSAVAFSRSRGGIRLAPRQVRW